ncbi:CipA protein [Pseudomassariella vexata]|uniref:CipA protein n=1 Tax=Pseudomassariella vexata TaxID=1141098 RepID=A0A1Y2DR23_9PEZI|nr:CipA protein [Pseudomassariella vexata]ORY61710.1 CipA protein [Pseudomassariella vexata]
MAHIKKVAIVGATGTVGSHIIQELLNGGKHEVTAITREDSKAEIPSGVKAAKVNYDDHTSLVSALEGQEVLIITMNVRAPQDQSLKLANAAADANVPFVIPNDWGCDIQNQALIERIPLKRSLFALHRHIEELGKSAWISIVENFWYEFSLGGGKHRYGFDFNERSVTFFDDGKMPINTTTWPQTGRAVAALLSLPAYPNGDGDKRVTLSSYKNKAVYISSFCISQKDMFESVLRVTATKEEDWKISYEDSAKRYEEAQEELKAGSIPGFIRSMYTPIFYPDGSGCYEKDRVLDNDVLGLPKEDLDEFTKIAISRKDVVY